MEDSLSKLRRDSKPRYLLAACSIGESVIATDVGSGRDDDGNDDPVIPVVFRGGDGSVPGRVGGERRW